MGREAETKTRRVGGRKEGNCFILITGVENIVYNYELLTHFIDVFQKMTLEQYEKVLAEKREALEALKKSEERKVTLDKELESMKVLRKNKEDEDVVIKLVCLFSSSLYKFARLAFIL